jgi:hypothetical protein
LASGDRLNFVAWESGAQLILEGQLEGLALGLL